MFREQDDRKKLPPPPEAHDGDGGGDGASSHPRTASPGYHEINWDHVSTWCQRCLGI